jgi:hypothetical protein
MKKIFTSLFALLFAMSLSAQPVYIWGGPGDPNSEFNGGFNDWTTVGVTAVPQDSAVNAVWVWDADGTDMGDPYRGNFSGEATRIESASAANGVALFPSDYYDNRGMPNNFGNGPAGRAHRGELISPAFDCSANATVAVQFTQSFRRFASTFSTLEVSIDGGASWEVFEINPYPVFAGITNKETIFGINVNQASRTNSVQVVDISSVAAGEENVQIKFAFEGGYYYWFIDDVYVIEAPENNLMMTHYFYTPGSYATPASQIETDTFVFIAGIKNIGGATANNVQLRADVILLLDSSVVHSDSVNVGTLERDSVVIAEIPRTWAPEVPEGVYQIRWSARNLDGPDYNLQDNQVSANFVVSAGRYSKEPAFTQTNRTAATDPWKIANLYSTGNEMAGGHFEVRSFQTALNHDNGLAGQEAAFYLAKIIDFDNFDASNTALFGHPNLELVGLSFPDPFTGAQAGQLITLPMYDFAHWDETGEFVEGAPLEPNENYLLIADFPALMQIGFNSAIPYFQISTVVQSGASWFFGGFGPDFSAVLRMDIFFDLEVNTKDLLPAETMTMFPNPASDFFTVDLDFGTATDATVVVADITGKVIDMKYVNGVAKEQVNFTTNGFRNRNLLSKSDHR